MKSYKYRLYPSKEQEFILNRTFDICRFTYNKLLELLTDKKDRNVLQHEIVNLKKEYPELKNVYSKTLQYECYRLFSNLKGLSELKKKNQKVGKLRFKGKKWFKTIVYNQSGFKYLKTNKRYDILKLSKIGDIKIRIHRIFKGNIKQIIIKKSFLGWYAFIVTDEEYKIKGGENNIGIDLGVINFITTNEGRKITNPLFMNKNIERLKTTSRKISKSKKGSKNRYKYRIALKKIWEKIDNQKNDYFHKITTNFIKKYKVICVEKLNISSMVKRKKHYNMRNILDSSWGKFISMLKFKAESAGSSIIDVNPKNTTKKCSRCGTIKNMKITDRIYKCPICNLVLDRDHNAAINIYRFGMSLCGERHQYPSFGQMFSMKQEAMSFRA